MKRILIFMISVLLIGMIAGCSNEKKADGNKQQDVTIMLDWYPNAVHSALYVAKEKGYFKDEGINLKIEMPADTNDPLKMAAVGKIDLAISYQKQVLLSRSEDIPVVSIGSYVQHPLDALIYNKSKGITRPKDLEGKKVGYASSPTSEPIIKTIVEHDGGDMSKVKMVDVGFDLIPALATGKVDALEGAYINHEYLLLQKEGVNVGKLSLEKNGVPDSSELVFVTGEKTLKTEKDTLSKFMKALTKGQDDVKKDPKSALNVLLEHENKNFKLDKKVETESLNILLPLMGDKTTPFGQQNPNQWKNVADWMYKTKITPKKVNYKDAFVNLNQ
ncbi:ABC transporter substrate-binding protein [Terrilactibacillus laevilacticus]|uniref:ABC transporter substrate-binding protein n=1 Tax=Terrilactibacillus laevilacticus TaxID=1380157 RepID=UPI0011472148|nr:ABC transporter substrate-binding protein [Terrilactibacillus laevilacticus]